MPPKLVLPKTSFSELLAPFSPSFSGGVFVSCGVFVLVSGLILISIFSTIFCITFICSIIFCTTFISSDSILYSLANIDLVFKSCQI